MEEGPHHRTFCRMWRRDVARLWRRGAAAAGGLWRRGTAVAAGLWRRRCTRERGRGRRCTADPRALRVRKRECEGGAMCRVLEEREVCERERERRRVARARAFGEGCHTLRD